MASFTLKRVLAYFIYAKVLSNSTRNGMAHMQVQLNATIRTSPELQGRFQKA